MQSKQELSVWISTISTGSKRRLRHTRVKGQSLLMNKVILARPRASAWKIQAKSSFCLTNKARAYTKHPPWKESPPLKKFNHQTINAPKRSLLRNWNAHHPLWTNQQGRRLLEQKDRKFHNYKTKRSWNKRSARLFQIVLSTESSCRSTQTIKASTWWNSTKYWWVKRSIFWGWLTIRGSIVVWSWRMRRNNRLGCLMG